MVAKANKHEKIHMAIAFVLLSGCQSGDDPTRIIESPEGDYRVFLSGDDLGACCSSTVSARLISSEKGFGELDEDLFEIRGASGVKLSWLTPYQMEVRVCNASKVSYRSDFPSTDYTKHIHVNLVNVLPERSEGQVICPDVKAR